jgi:hypothetical protein
VGWSKNLNQRDFLAFEFHYLAFADFATFASFDVSINLNEPLSDEVLGGTSAVGHVGNLHQITQIDMFQAWFEFDVFHILLFKPTHQVPAFFLFVLTTCTFAVADVVIHVLARRTGLSWAS